MKQRGFNPLRSNLLESLRLLAEGEVKAMLDFFINGELSPNLGVNSHLLQHETDTEDYLKKEQIWQSDLEDLVQEEQVKPTYDVKYS